MTVQEVAKSVMKITNTSQREVAEKNHLSGQGAVAMFLRSKSMQVDNLLKILNTCGYELVARSVNGEYPEFVIGSELSGNQPAPVEKVRSDVQSSVQSNVQSDVEKTMREMIRKMVAEEVRNVMNGEEV